MLSLSESKRLLSALFPDYALFGLVELPPATSLQIARTMNQVLEALQNNGHYGRVLEMELNQDKTWQKAPSGNYKESEMAKYLNKILEVVDSISAEEFKTQQWAIFSAILPSFNIDAQNLGGGWSYHTFERIGC